jgi:hypothetical protein
MSNPPSDINLFLQSRVDFFRRYRSERSMTSFLQNENRLISLLSSERSASLLRNVSISLASPMLSSFLDPVFVGASEDQQNTAFRVPTTTPEGSCSICQEGFVEGGNTIRLRNCGHCFHRECAQSWYRMSVYCPLCRNDIRTPAS